MFLLAIPRRCTANNDKNLLHQVVVEIKKGCKIILEEDRRDIYTEISGEVFANIKKSEESIDSQGATKKLVKLMA